MGGVRPRTLDHLAEAGKLAVFIREAVGLGRAGGSTAVFADAVSGRFHGPSVANAAEYRSSGKKSQPDTHFGAGRVAYKSADRVADAGPDCAARADGLAEPEPLADRRARARDQHRPRCDGCL